MITIETTGSDVSATNAIIAEAFPGQIAPRATQGGRLGLEITCDRRDADRVRTALKNAGRTVK